MTSNVTKLRVYGLLKNKPAFEMDVDVDLCQADGSNAIITYY